MDSTSFALLVLNFLFICLLPFVFYKRGEPTLMWLVACFPYMLAPLVTLAVYAGWLPSLLSPDSAVYEVSALAGVVLSVGSIALMFLSMGTHRVPPAICHQKPENDVPVDIVTWGVYGRIRHPFYSSFILAGLANVLIAPAWANLFLCLYIPLVLHQTAVKEETRLGSDPTFGEQYSAYIERSGRFWPTWKRADPGSSEGGAGA